MKRLLIALMALAAVSVHAQVLGVESSIEVGSSSSSFGEVTIMDYWGEIVEWGETDVYYTHLEAYVWLWSTVYAGGGVTTQVVRNRRAFSGGETHKVLPTFTPFFSNYSFEAGVVLGPVVGFIAHDCTHPQVVYPWQHRVTSVWGEGSVTRVGVRFVGTSGAVGSRR